MHFNWFEKSNKLLPGLERKRESILSNSAGYEVGQALCSLLLVGLPLSLAQLGGTWRLPGAGILLGPNQHPPSTPVSQDLNFPLRIPYLLCPHPGDTDIRLQVLFWGNFILK